MRDGWILRFNGAATLQLRKPNDNDVISYLKLELQWGRNFAVAETRTGVRDPCRWYIRLQWGRNFAVAET